MARGAITPWMAALALFFAAACSSPPPRDPPGQTPLPTLPPATPTATATPSATRQEGEARIVLASAVASLGEGQGDSVLSLLRAAIALAPPASGTAQAAQYLLGRQLLRSGEAAAAADALALAADHPGPLAPYARLALAAALLQLDDSEGASVLYAELASGEATPPDVREAAIVALADAAPDSGPRPGAEGLTGPGPLLALARRLAADPSDPELRAVLERLLAGHPATPEALAAIALAAKASVSLPPELVGLAYYRNRRLAEAIEVLEPAAADPSAPPPVRAMRTYYLAAAIDDAGDPAGSIPLYREVIAIDPSSPLAYRARYWEARALEATGETEAASQRYVELVISSPAGVFAADAAFRAGFVWYLAGAPGRALSAWEGVLDRADARTLYWRGRALELASPGLAASSYRAAAATTPSFYAEEAGRRLAGTSVPYPAYRPLPDRERPDWDAAAAWFASRTGTPAPPWRRSTAATVLHSLGLQSEAQTAITAAAAEADEPGLLQLVREASEAGLAYAAAVTLQRLLDSFPTPYDDLPPALRQVLYPLPHPDLLDEQARAAGLDPLLLAALVRQESLWNPDAVSLAGAIGLTQVLPATGADIARALRVQPFDPDSLRDPYRSLQFGAYYLGLQLGAFLSPAAALAAYNGGFRNAIGWSAAADPVTDPAAYLEAITFPETRRYVEVVLTAYARYRALAAD